MPTFPCLAWAQPVPTLALLMSSIPETVRILGSLLIILLLFALTAVLVKVDMSPGPFFSITMASVWFINCEHHCPCPPPCQPTQASAQPSL